MASKKPAKRSRSSSGRKTPAKSKPRQRSAPRGPAPRPTRPRSPAYERRIANAIKRGKTMAQARGHGKDVAQGLREAQFRRRRELKAQEAAGVLTDRDKGKLRVWVYRQAARIRGAEGRSLWEQYRADIIAWATLNGMNFFDELRRRVAEWSARGKVGDLASLSAALADLNLPTELTWLGFYL